MKPPDPAAFIGMHPEYVKIYIEEHRKATQDLQSGTFFF
jgi:hypothetical protein